MKVGLSWAGGATFIGESENGQRIVMDGPPEAGGRDLGPRPMETLLLGMAACSAFDVMLILGKAQQSVSDCKVDIRAQRAAEHPKVFTEIHVHFIITGADIDEKKLARAIKLSADKYCSASIMLGKVADISHSYEIKSAE